MPEFGSVEELRAHLRICFSCLVHHSKLFAIGCAKSLWTLLSCGIMRHSTDIWAASITIYNYGWLNFICRVAVFPWAFSLLLAITICSAGVPLPVEVLQEVTSHLLTKIELAAFFRLWAYPDLHIAHEFVRLGHEWHSVAIVDRAAPFEDVVITNYERRRWIVGDHCFFEALIEAPQEIFVGRLRFKLQTENTLQTIMEILRQDLEELESVLLLKPLKQVVAELHV